MKKDLPIYDVYISDDKQGVAMISLVDDPAIKVNWIKLKSHEQLLDLPMTLTDRGICFGCPPNGDGTRVNGEPDARCKEGGDDKKSGRGKTSTPKSPNQKATAKYETEETIKKDYKTISNAEAKEQGKLPGIYSKNEQNVSIQSTNGQDYVMPLSWAKKISENGLYDSRDGGRLSTSGSLLARGELRIGRVTWERRSDGNYTIGVYTSGGGRGGTGYAKL